MWKTHLDGLFPDAGVAAGDDHDSACEVRHVGDAPFWFWGHVGGEVGADVGHVDGRVWGD